jgi:hypothetical protein
MEWGILKEKFRAAAAERSDEMEGVGVSGELPNDEWVKICGIDNLGPCLVGNFFPFAAFCNGCFS